MNKLVIIGLDCATPQLVFGEFRDQLPNLSALMCDGVYGPLTSTIPPITVPAWTCMMSSQDPGMLGIYGFRNRSNHNYDDLFFANANYVKAKTVWNHFSRNRMKSLVFGVPQTYPPKPLNGLMVSCFLTPNKEVNYTYPAELKAELETAAEGDYIFDLDNFRTDDKSKLLTAIYAMTRRRFKAFRHFLGKESYDFAMMVEMGIDRIHHGFWRYYDKTHRLYEPGNPFESAILDFYKEIDREVGETLAMLSPDTSVMVVSDHGAKAMQGAICVNEWLMREGYLTLKEPPVKRGRLTMDMIDWSKTKAWGEGGYYCRLFMNVAGREPQGTIPAADYEAVRDEIKAKLEAITDEEGNLIGTKALKPEETYRQVNGIPPDLTVYLGNLDWRSSGSVGVGSVYMYENDTGPDDANHAQEGIFIAKLAGGKSIPQRDGYSIYDIAPTLMRFYDLDIPEEMIGTSLVG